MKILQYLHSWEGIKFIVVRIPSIPFRMKRKFYATYNKVKFRLAGVKYGRGMLVFFNIYLSKARGSKIVIGDSFTFTSGGGLNPLSRNIKGCIHAGNGAEIIIGNHTGMSSACLWAKTSIRVGDRVKIGGDCILLDTDCHNLDYRIRGGGEDL